VANTPPRWKGREQSAGTVGANFEAVRQSRSVWTARVFSTAFPPDFDLVIVLILAIAFFQAGFEDEDEDDPASVF
jgi:hypothetical protein